MAAAGEPGALRALARWLGGLPGRQWDAEAVLREAGVAGDSGATTPARVACSASGAAGAGRPG
jgi:hypothetical protein